jgi:hypothetical protein
MPTFTNVFGGNVILPSQVSLLQLAMTADVQLQWPIEQATSTNVVAAIIEVTASAGGLSVIFPDATQGSLGYPVVFNNVGSNTFSVKSSTGSTLMTVASGLSWFIYLEDNSTAGGTWQLFQMGAGTSSANAGALAGAGLKAVTTTLNEAMLPSAKSTDYTIVDGDRAKVIEWTGGVGTLTLPDPSVVGTDWFVIVKNAGSGTVNLLAAAGTIDDGASINFSPNQSAFIYSDGTNLHTVGLGQQVNSVFDFISINVAGTGDYTLSGAQLNRIAYKFTGVLTGDRNVIVPNTVQQYWVDNETTGAFTLSVKTAAQITGISIPQTQRTILYCDGTNVVNAETILIVTPVSIAQGGTGATTAPTALANLGGVSDTRVLTAGAGLTGGGDLSADRTFDVGQGTGITVNANDVALDTASTRNTDHATVTITAGAGLTGGGDISATRTLDVGQGTGITVNANDVALDTASTRNVDHTAVSISTANSLTGGGDITATRTLSLVNDAASPGNSKYYGTDSGGTKGFFVVTALTGFKAAMGAVEGNALAANSIGVTSVTHAGTGSYTIDVTAAGFANKPFTQCTPQGIPLGLDNTVAAIATSPTSISVQTFVNTIGLADMDFNFCITGT